MVRQENVREEIIRPNSYAEQRSPVKRTFAEAKQNLNDYNNVESNVNIYNEMGYNENSFLEIDEDEFQDQPLYKTNYSSSDSKVQYTETDNVTVTQISTHNHSVRSADSFLHDNLPEYFHPEESTRLLNSRKEKARRRRSRDLNESDIPEITDNAADVVIQKRKPETMRSISEDLPPRIIKPVTKRSLSHPEKETQTSVKRIDFQKIPSPKPLIDIVERTKTEQLLKVKANQRNECALTDTSDTSLTGKIIYFNVYIYKYICNTNMQIYKYIYLYYT